MLLCDLTDLLPSLKNHGMEAEVDAMFDVGMEALDLPLEEKMKYEQGDSGYSFGLDHIHSLSSRAR